jgi:hypothetical protein
MIRGTILLEHSILVLLLVRRVILALVALAVFIEQLHALADYLVDVAICVEDYVVVGDFLPRSLGWGLGLGF